MADEKAVIGIIRAARPSFSGAHDKMAFAVHACFLASGHVLHAAGPPAFGSKALYSAATDEVGIRNWNQLGDDYAFLYSNPENGSKKVLVKCHAINDKLPVDALVDDSSEPAHLEINVGDYDKENGGTNYGSMYKNLDKLVDSVNKEILAKLYGDSFVSSVVRASSSTRPSSMQLEINGRKSIDRANPSSSEGSGSSNFMTEGGGRYVPCGRFRLRCTKARLTGKRKEALVAARRGVKKIHYCHSTSQQSYSGENSVPNLPQISQSVPAKQIKFLTKGLANYDDLKVIFGSTPSTGKLARSSAQGPPTLGGRPLEGGWEEPCCTPGATSSYPPAISIGEIEEILRKRNLSSSGDSGKSKKSRSFSRDDFLGAFTEATQVVFGNVLNAKAEYYINVLNAKAEYYKSKTACLDTASSPFRHPFSEDKCQDAILALQDEITEDQYAVAMDKLPNLSWRRSFLTSPRHFQLAMLRR